MRVALVCFCVLVAANGGCDRAPPAPTPAPGAAPRQQPTASVAPKPSPTGQAPHRAADLDVYEVITGGARTEDRLPLIVAVHGLGDHPRSFAGIAAGFPARARVALPRAPEPYGDGFSWFAFSPEMSEADLAAGLRKACDRLARAIDDFARSRPTDGRPIVTGFSQGGMLSFALAAQRPSMVRAAYPLGGLLPESLWPSAKTSQAPPVVALHGEADALVPIAPARRTVQALAEHGYDARLEAFPGVGHSVPIEMRRRLFSLLEQSLSSPSRNPKQPR